MLHTGPSVLCSGGSGHLVTSWRPARTPGPEPLRPLLTRARKPSLLSLGVAGLCHGSGPRPQSNQRGRLDPGVASPTVLGYDAGGGPCRAHPRSHGCGRQISRIRKGSHMFSLTLGIQDITTLHHPGSSRKRSEPRQAWGRGREKGRLGEGSRATLPQQCKAAVRCKPGNTEY